MANLFPRWTNNIPYYAMAGAPLVLGGAVFFVWYWLSPYNLDVGYQPKQPVPYSHRLHVTELGLDCRYCHSTVEEDSFAAIPPTATCMNCHTQVKTDSPKLQLVRESWETGEPIPWVKIHQLPDYAYFYHNVHVAAGIGCASCHGRVDRMEVVSLAEPLSMGWCIKCHRDPAPHLRPLDQVTNMNWDPETAGYDPTTDPNRKPHQRNPNPPLHCSGCHR